MPLAAQIDVSHTPFYRSFVQHPRSYSKCISNAGYKSHSRHTGFAGYTQAPTVHLPIWSPLSQPYHTLGPAAASINDHRRPLRTSEETYARPRRLLRPNVCDPLRSLRCRSVSPSKTLQKSSLLWFRQHKTRSLISTTANRLSHITYNGRTNT